MSSRKRAPEPGPKPASQPGAVEPHGRDLGAGLAIGAAWLAAAALVFFWPDRVANARTGLFAELEAAAGAALAGIHGFRSAAARVRPASQWLLALPVILTVWEFLTAKTGLLPLPMFASPQSVLEVYTDDYARLADSAVSSLILLLPGYLIGGVFGFGVGVGIGWSRVLSYWGNPVVRVIGPLPATAWLPIAFFFFPSSRSASTFLIALATAFPVVVLTASGVRGVNKTYYDVARTFSASTRFLLWRVAIPASLPHVFVGLFMGLGGSFAILIFAEMMGVKAGLGWYLQWAQGWAAYANIYAALLVMAFLFSGLIALLFHVRDRSLGWQKGVVQW